MNLLSSFQSCFSRSFGFCFRLCCCRCCRRCSFGCRIGYSFSDFFVAIVALSPPLAPFYPLLCFICWFCLLTAVGSSFQRHPWASCWGLPWPFGGGRLHLRIGWLRYGIVGRLSVDPCLLVVGNTGVVWRCSGCFIYQKIPTGLFIDFSRIPSLCYFESAGSWIIVATSFTAKPVNPSCFLLLS